MNEGICKICEATFRPQAMEGEKCISCNKLYPNAHSRKEIMNPQKAKAETLTDITVKAMVYEILEEANIKRHNCEKCKELFFRQSPAAKFCPVCKEKK